MFKNSNCVKYLDLSYNKLEVIFLIYLHIFLFFLFIFIEN